MSEPAATSPSSSNRGGNAALYVLLPILIVLSTLLFILLTFLVGLIILKRKSRVRLQDEGGPLDISRNDGVIGEGGIAGVESRWLEQVDGDVREGYRRGKDWQTHNAPASLDTEITLSQFLSIQEKGVSAWCFEPDYESNPSLYVESRTEITFLADGPGMAPREGGGNTVLANLPVPKLNEVYYWEAKIYEKPPATEVVIGLATKPFPHFRMPGQAKISVGYASTDGFKSHNYPFTASSYGPPLAEGDVLGVGYRPRTGTVFYTRNGKKLEDCYTGLASLNLFPAVGANGSATVHVNLGQAGFVFIEANVKKWGLAPMMGTLAPPPAYGSERGSILLDAGYGAPGARTITPDVLHAARRLIDENAPSPSRPIPGTTNQGHRRGYSQPVAPSPLRNASLLRNEAGGSSSLSPLRIMPGRTLGQARYRSPSDTPDLNRTFPDASALEEGRVEITEEEDSDSDASSTSSRQQLRRASSPGGSPLPHNPPTPNILDISLRSIHTHNTSRDFFGGRASEEQSGESGSSDDTARQDDDVARRERRRQRREERRANQLASQGQDGLQARLSALVASVMGPADVPPPGYAPLDPHRYADGVPTDLPPEIISRAFEDRTTQANTLHNAQPASTSFWNRLTGRG